MEKRPKRRQYTIEFKLDAVRLVLNEGYSVAKAAERLGISSKNLYHWKEQFANAPFSSIHSAANRFSSTYQALLKSIW